MVSPFSNDSSQLNFLQEALSQSGGKSFGLTICTFLTLVDIVLLYGIIWYERFGRDQPRTLINQQVASICWSAIFWMALVEVPLIIRFWINKPFNETVCKVQMILNQVLTVSSLLLIDSVAIVRYVMIFCLKNPGALEDDFWNLFVNIWIYMFAALSQIVYLVSTGHWNINFYICTGIHPYKDYKNESSKFLGIQNAVLIFSLLCHLVISARIKIFKRRSLRQVLPGPLLAENSVSELLDNKKKSMLMDMTVLIFFVLAAPFTYSYNKANQMQSIPDLIEQYPFYLIIYLYHFVLPLTAHLSFVFIFYFRNRGLCLCIPDERIKRKNLVLLK